MRREDDSKDAIRVPYDTRSQVWGSELPRMLDLSTTRLGLIISPQYSSIESQYRDSHQSHRYKGKVTHKESL